jgi:drug/metabolite transporter (DMT)-like permease
MENKSRNSGALVGGVLLILFGLLALFTQLFQGFDFWGTFWPFIIIGVGGMFFVGMAAGGRSTSGLAVPGAIISTIGLMLFFQNLTNHWESWAYGWAVIVFAVGLGIYIMGWWGQNAGQRKDGMGVMKVGGVLFIIFGAFFELIFRTSTLADYIFPAALILLGLYLIIRRAGLFTGKGSDGQPGEPTL